MPHKIISGGQTGVDRAALDAAMAAGLETGGWCPPGRLAEDGLIPATYPLRETPAECSPDAPDVPRSQRTAWNVRDADATLIISPGPRPTDPGTLYAFHCAEKYGKPALLADADRPDLQTIRTWLAETRCIVLNVAGPSEGDSPGIYLKSYDLLAGVFSA